MTVLCVLPAHGCAPQRHSRGITQLRQTPLYTLSEQEVDAYLRWFHDAEPATTKRVIALAQQNLGQPYRMLLLGEWPHELYDPDPMYCLSASDCVTFVEQTYAMALSHDWPSFFRTLQRIRYKNGEVGMLTRNHFTEADWNVNNAWLFDDVTADVGGRAVVPLRARIDRPAFFAKYGIGGGIPVQEFESRYIPRNAVPPVLGKLRDADVIEIVRGDATLQHVGHLGLAAHTADGTVTMIHSGKPAVHEEPLGRYVERHPNVLGLKVLRMRRTAGAGDES